VEKHRRNADGQGTGSFEKQQLEQNRMKEVWESILVFLESVGKARAASELVRAGKYEEAKRLMEADTEVHP
jgi:hypothetical protein